jgi:trans-aconitate 2-methyltransferase
LRIEEDAVRWDPAQYTRYADERGRPFLDLLARVGAHAPRRVVDLGCGPGNLTALLRERWPSAIVEGLDSSPEMIERARTDVPGVQFAVGDVRTWTMPADCDVLISNATLQWVPEHRELLRSWADALPSGGWLAMQVPGNFDAPSHQLMRSLATSPRWAPLVGDVLRHDVVATPAGYAAVLLDAGLEVDVWETTYLHLLQGEDPVLEWVRGTGLRPILAALSASPHGATSFDAEIWSADGGSGRFEREYAALLREAYPPTAHGTLFEFRRIFAVAHKPA